MPQAEPQRDHCRAAVADERQRHADDGQDAADHAHVDEGVGEERQRDRAGQQPGEEGWRLGGNHQAAKDQEDEAEDQRGAAGGLPNSSENAAKMKSVVRSGMNSRCVCVPFMKPLPVRAARADGGDPALDDVEPLAQRVGRRVERR